MKVTTPRAQICGCARKCSPFWEMQKETRTRTRFRCGQGFSDLCSRCNVYQSAHAILSNFHFQKKWTFGSNFSFMSISFTCLLCHFWMFQYFSDFGEFFFLFSFVRDRGFVHLCAKMGCKSTTPKRCGGEECSKLCARFLSDFRSNEFWEPHWASYVLKIICSCSKKLSPKGDNQTHLGLDTISLCSKFCLSSAR